MVFLELNDLVADSFDLVIALVEIGLERFLVDDASLLLQFLILLPQALPQLLEPAELRLLIVKDVIEVL